MRVPEVHMCSDNLSSGTRTHFSGLGLKVVECRPNRLHKLSGHAPNSGIVVEGVLFRTLFFVTSQVKLANQPSYLDELGDILGYQRILARRYPLQEPLAVLACNVIREYDISQTFLASPSESFGCRGINMRVSGMVTLGSCIRMILV